MQTRLGTTFLAATVLLAGCGGGSPATGPPGRLGFRLVWRQGAAATATRRPAQASGLPSGVNTIRIGFSSASGLGCCVAINAGAAPDGTVVLNALPSGGATVVVAGFSTTFAPAISGITSQCSTDPATVGQPCDSSQSASPTYESQPQQVTIVPGVVTDAGTIELLPVSATPTPAVGTPTPAETVAATPTGPVNPPTPIPTPTLVPTVIIVRNGGDIGAAARRAPPGAILVVSPGLYAPLALQPGDLQGPLTIVADVTGLLTGSAPAAVTIRSPVQGAAVQLLGQSDLVLDGFALRNGNGSGVRVQDSQRVVVRNCVISGNPGDGVDLEQSQDTLVFNNLIFENNGAGVRATGTVNLQVINNTVYRNVGSGFTLGSATGTLVENNIFNANTPVGIAVDGVSAASYGGDFNLNSDGYGPGTPSGAHDLNAPGDDNPLFISPRLGDFHLEMGVSGSVSPAIDAGIDSIAAQLLGALEQRTTQVEGTLDALPVDLGYHYLPPNAFSTPTPGPKPTPTRQGGRAAG